MKIKRILIAGMLVAALLVVQAGVVFAQDDPDNPEVTTEDESQEPLMPGQNPVAYFMAGVMGVTYDEVRDLQQEGYGFGNISKAYYLCSVLSTLQTPDEGSIELEDGETDGTTVECGPDDLTGYLEDAKGMGWGNLIKQLQAQFQEQYQEMYPDEEFILSNGHGVGWFFKYAKGETTEKHHGKPEWAGGPKDHPNNGKGNNKE
jgi:hypothetical protein